MLSKSFALLAAFAAFSPAFAAPLPDKLVDVTAVVQNDVNNLKTNVLTRGPAAFEEVVRRLELSGRGNSGCSLADIDIIVSNVLNNATINVLSPAKRSDCDILGITVEVVDVLNNLDVNVLSPGRSKRSEDQDYSLAQIENIVTELAKNTGTKKATRSTGDKSLVDVTAVVDNVLNNLDVNVLTKRGDKNLVGVTAVVDNVLNNLDVNILTKRGDFTVTQIAQAVKDAVNNANTSASKRSGTGPTVEGLTDEVLESLSAVIAKRARNSNIVAAVTNDINNAKVDVL